MTYVWISAPFLSGSFIVISIFLFLILFIVKFSTGSGTSSKLSIFLFNSSNSDKGGIIFYFSTI